MLRGAGKATVSLFLILLLSFPVSASAIESSVKQNAPVISSSISFQSAEPREWVSISGLGFLEVTEVFVDSNKASFEILSDSSLRLQVPLTTSPGDAVVRLVGSFGLISYPNLLQVLPLSEVIESKVTIGTFQGYAAVYTKNFKGKELKITIGNRQRLIPELHANFTQNLTKVGVGKVVSVMVFVDQELVQVRELVIK